jgi:hypothetical protein
MAASLGWVLAFGCSVLLMGGQAEPGPRRPQAVGALSLGGIVDAQDATASPEACRRAAERGEAEAQARLAAMCYLGKGVPRDVAEAVKWFRLASAQGDATAQGCLGTMYALGDGVPQDRVQAYAWLLLASAGGNEQAGELLATLEPGLSAAQIRDARQRSSLANTHQP